MDMHRDPIEEFLKAVESAAIEETGIYADNAVLDATVPNWRLRAVGPEAIKAEYARWFCEPATFVALERIPVPDGELVIYEHEFVQDGVRHRGHHAHHPENYMPLARAALYALGIDVYLAPTWDNSDVWVPTLRHIANEGRVYVIGGDLLPAGLRRAPRPAGGRGDLRRRRRLAGPR